MKKRKLITILSLLAIAAMTVTGCGAGANETATETAAETTAETAAEETKAEETAAAEDAAPDIDEFKEKMSAYSSVKSIAEKYGSFKCTSVCEYYTLGLTQTITASADGDYFCVDLSDDNTAYLTDGESLYIISDENDSVPARIVEFDTESYTEYLSGYLDIGMYDFGSDESPVLTKEADGYKWVQRVENYDYGGVTATVEYVTHVSEDYTVIYSSAEVTGEDGVIMHETRTYSYGEPVQRKEQLETALAESEGKTRHLTYNIVDGSEIVKSYETDVPMGMYCVVALPSEYDDAEQFSDIELTIPDESSDRFADCTVYMQAAK